MICFPPSPICFTSWSSLRLIDDILRGRNGVFLSIGPKSLLTGGTRSVSWIGVVFPILLNEQFLIKWPSYHMLSIPCLPFSNHACIVRTSDNTYISFAEGEVRVIALLAGYPGVWLSLHLPSTERVSSLTSFASHPDASFSIPVLPHERG